MAGDQKYFSSILIGAKFEIRNSKSLARPFAHRVNVTRNYSQELSTAIQTHYIAPGRAETNLIRLRRTNDQNDTAMRTQLFSIQFGTLTFWSFDFVSIFDIRASDFLAIQKRLVRNKNAYA
jgi:hypothetical protein